MRDLLMPPCIPQKMFALSVAAALSAAAVADISAARADPADRLWDELQVRADGCGTAANGSLSQGARCLLGAGLTVLFDEGAGLANEYGKEAFGPRFRLVGKPAYSLAPDGIGLSGDLDVVIPFAGKTPSVAEQPSGSALFLQQGVTDWRDSAGAQRNDLRYGPVYRFRVSEAPDAGILGLSLLQLHNAERRHKVLVPGIDYAGRWGSGSLRHFIPTTSWRPGRRGREERALGGTELSARLRLTTTLGMSAAYLRESGTTSGRRTDGMRLGFGWRPHHWLHLGASYDRSGTGGDGVSFRVGFRMPLGSRVKPPRWEGLGVAAGGSAPDASELWRPVEGDGRIRTVARDTVSGPVAGAEVRFLQDSVESGDSILLEVVLSSPAPEDIAVEVRLVPGAGGNPAVPGQDFVDEPVRLTISAGASTGRVSVQLLRNNGLGENRSLSATVSLVS